MRRRARRKNETSEWRSGSATLAAPLPPRIALTALPPPPFLPPPWMLPWPHLASNLAHSALLRRGGLPSVSVQPGHLCRARLLAARQGLPFFVAAGAGAATTRAPSHPARHGRAFSSAPATMAPSPTRTMLWFRKGLRLHDNPALLDAAGPATTALFPVFCLDPHFLHPDRVGPNRLGFLFEALADLDASLRDRGSRLIVLRGDPAVELPKAWAAWAVGRLVFEADGEPYALKRDATLSSAAAAAGVATSTHLSHTLWDPAAVAAAAKAGGGAWPPTYQSFIKATARVGPPGAPAADPPAALPPADGAPDPALPALVDLAAYAGLAKTSPFLGGETVGLARLDAACARPAWLASFEKPKTSPTELFAAPGAGGPSTTALSPYLKFGCVSARTVHARVAAVIAGTKGTKTAPPVSLEGQLLWREFYYAVAAGTPHYHVQAGNPICRQIPWAADPALLAAWTDARTGFPWIDAAMTQLRQEGWMHHLARHAVACFLTRGDLFQPWEAGAAVFDRLLLDADLALNAGNWMWLSASAFFHQYFRVYSPIAFPQKYDKAGAYARHYLPVLARLPDKYVYTPWEAPLEVQRAAGCVVGVDYPAPIVDHATASKDCMARMRAAYEAGKGEGGGGGGGGGGKREGGEAGGGGGGGGKKSKKG